MYFFDLEDYRNAGYFGRNYSGTTIDKLGFVLETPAQSPWGQFDYSAYVTFRATRDAHYKAVNEYYLASINVADVSNRLNIFNANKTFCEKGGLFKVKELEFWGMMGSFAFKRLFDDEIIANGDIVSVKHQFNLSEEEKANGHLFLFNHQGDNETPSYYAFIQPEGTPTNLEGQMSFSNSIEAGDLFTIKYTQFDVNIYNEYKTALQEMMAAEKALIVSIDGEQTIIA